MLIKRNAPEYNLCGPTMPEVAYVLAYYVHRSMLWAAYHIPHTGILLLQIDPVIHTIEYEKVALSGG